MPDPLTEINFQNARLADFLQFISDLTTIPISVDPLALQIGGSLDAKVSVKMAETNVGEVLTAALKSVSLSYSIQEQGLLVTYSSLANPGPKTIKHDVADLAPSGDDAEALAAAIRKLVAPRSWGEPGAVIDVGPGELEITQPMNRQVAIRSLLERLRVARGSAPKSANPASFRLALPAEEAAARLQKHVTLNYLSPTPFTSILKRLEKESQVDKVGQLRFTVDWDAVASEGWNPRGEATLTVEKATAQAALEKLLADMELGYRLLGRGVIEITSIEKAATQLEIQFHPVSGLVGEPAMHEVFLKRIRTALGEELFTTGESALHIDATSNHLIANLSQPDQHRLAEQLAVMRVAP